jgi:hypothetical protein
MRFFNSKNVFGILTGFVLLLLPMFVIAVAPPTGGSGLGGSTGGSGIGSPTGGSGISGGSAELKNPLGVSSFQDLAKALLNAAIVIGIPIAVLFIVFAGFKFVLARGNPEALKIARKNLLYTIVGIAIFIGASLIAGVITSTLHQLGATGF